MNDHAISICCQCDGMIQENMVHSCIRGLTDNLNRLHHNLNVMYLELEKQLERSKK